MQLVPFHQKVQKQHFESPPYPTLSHLVKNECYARMIRKKKPTLFFSVKLFSHTIFASFKTSFFHSFPLSLEYIHL